MEKDILISIIVPVYNIKDYIERCIESIINQTYRNIEIILIDDGSSDGSGEICDSYAKRDNRIRVVHKRNGGIVSARKVGGNIAQGEYILSVDGDDWIETNYVFNIVKEGISKAADMIYLSGYYQEYSNESYFVSEKNITGVFNEKEIREKFIKKISEDKVCFQRDIILRLWSFCIRKDIYMKGQEYVNDKLYCGEDVIGLLGCLLKSHSLVCIPGYGYHYVRRENSLTNNIYSMSTDKQDRNIDLFYRQAKKNFLSESGDKTINKIILQYTFASLTTLNYRRLLKKESEFLFPYTQVKKGSKVVIYGAGAVGRRMVQAIKLTDGFEIVAWTDQYKQGMRIDGYTIVAPAEVVTMEFEYIVMAINMFSVAEEAGNKLISLGISNYKIAYMDPSVITEEYLPEDLKVL